MEQVAHLLGVCWDTVKEIVKRHLGKRFGRPKLKKVRQIAIDEIAVGKGHDYMTVSWIWQRERFFSSEMEKARMP